MEQLNYCNTFEINDEKEKEYIGKEGNKKSIISFSKLNKYYLIPFILPIFFLIIDFFSDLIAKSKVINKSDFIDSIFTSLSLIFAGLFYFIPYFKVNYNKKNDSQFIKEISNELSKYFYIKINKYNSCKILIFIILLSLIIAIEEFHYIFLLDKTIIEKRIYFLFFIPLFSKIILKEHLYKHHYFALIISIIGIIFLLIPVCLSIRTDDIISNILNLIIGIIYPLFMVLIKYIIEKYYIHPLKISFSIGVISLFFTFIIYLIFSLIKYNDLSYFSDIFDFSKTENNLTIIIYIILYNIFYIIMELLFFLALFYFSPTLLIITNMISPFINWIIESIKEGMKIPDSVLYPIGYLIVIFSSFIYNEIIIFNFCGLNINTKIFVHQRIYIEKEEIKKDSVELLSVDEN